MFGRSRRRWYISAIALTIAAPLLLTAGARMRARGSCGTVEANWVAAHRGHLPATLSELARYPISYRRAIYRVLPVRTRVGLWRAQFSSVIRKGSLTAAQKVFLMRFRRNLNRYVSPDADENRLEALKEQGEVLFGRNRFIDIFENLGSPEASEASAISGLTPSLGDCNCYNDADCGGLAYCANTGCAIGLTGCGIVHNEPCYGQCSY